MGEYDRKHFIENFIARTNENLKTIKELKECVSEDEYFEITQLINSLLGLLVVPYEHYKNNDNKVADEKKIKKYKKEYDNILNIIYNAKNLNHLYSNFDFDKNYKVTRFIRHLRDALSHDGILFLDEAKVLIGVIFYDTDKEIVDLLNKKDNSLKREVHEFCVELDIPSVEILVKNISQIYSNISGENSESIEKYTEKISDKEKLFEKSDNIWKNRWFEQLVLI